MARQKSTAIKQDDASEPTSSMAKDRPVLASGAVYTEDFEVGQDGEARFEGDDLIKPETRTLDDPYMKQKADMLRFMEDDVTIQILDTAEQNADFGFTVEVNRKKEHFVRGQVKTVKRYIVATLAQAKRTTFKNQLRVDPITQEQQYVYPSSTGLRYPFSVVNDPAGDRGAKWLQQVLRQA